MNIVSTVLATISQILSAGVAITTIALLMYALGFNFRDRLVQTFLLILGCVVLIYTSETIASISRTDAMVAFWLRVKWAGLVLLPAVYLHFSDALLTITGKPSRGRRRLVVKIVYFITIIGVAAIPFGLTVGSLSPTTAPTAYLQPTIITFFFGIFYILVMAMSGYNLLRTISRSITPTSRRRLMYLFAGATAPAFSSILFLFHGSPVFNAYPNLFWTLAIIGALLTGVFLVLMTYAVSFFGVPWTDRAIKSRLFRWLMRGPFVAAVVLGLTAIVRRYGETLGDPYIAYVPVAMVATILILEYCITLLAPYLEKAIFFGDDRENLTVIRSLEERMLTKKDLNQFLEVIAASICDRLHVSSCFIAIFEDGQVTDVIQVGGEELLHYLPLTHDTIEKVQESDFTSEFIIRWADLFLIPLRQTIENESPVLLGICGFPAGKSQAFDQEDLNAIIFLTERATLALKDRALQNHVIQSLTLLQNEVDYIQRLRARSSYDHRGIYQNGEPEAPGEVTDWVKDALTHYWGGPKLTKNPLLDLKIVNEASARLDGNRANALRAILKEAIDKTKPEGERKYTGDWLFYNILDLKFLQGKKVRDVANRLAVSEADLYRKQRIALENVAQIIMKMEQEKEAESQEPIEDASAQSAFTATV